MIYWRHCFRNNYGWKGALFEDRLSRVQEAINSGVTCIYNVEIKPDNFDKVPKSTLISLYLLNFSEVFWCSHVDTKFDANTHKI